MVVATTEFNSKTRSRLAIFAVANLAPVQARSASEGWTYARIAIEQESLACAAGLYSVPAEAGTTNIYEQAAKHSDTAYCQSMLLRFALANSADSNASSSRISERRANISTGCNSPLLVMQ